MPETEPKKRGPKLKETIGVLTVEEIRQHLADGNSPAAVAKRAGVSKEWLVEALGIRKLKPVRMNVWYLVECE